MDKPRITVSLTYEIDGDAQAAERDLLDEFCRFNGAVHSVSTIEFRAELLPELTTAANAKWAGRAE